MFDIYLTENCNMLEKLLLGDMILAKRGFTIQEGAGLFSAEVKIVGYSKLMINIKLYSRFKSIQ